MENVVLMRMAKESLRGKWGLAIGTFLVYALIVGGGSFSGIATLIVGGPMTLGLALFSLSIARNQEARLEQLFKGFNNFGTSLGAYLLMIIFVLLWTILLIIP